MDEIMHTSNERILGTLVKKVVTQQTRYKLLSRGRIIRSTKGQIIRPPQIFLKQEDFNMYFVDRVNYLKD
jgi:hypothetical protein